jgi:hypothetical protein
MAKAKPKPTLYFQGGTLVLNDVGEEAQLDAPFRWIKDHWRCEAYHYASLLPWLKAQKIRDTLPRWEHLDLTLHDTRDPHPISLKR